MDNILRLRTVKLINSLMHPLVTEGVIRVNEEQLCMPSEPHGEGDIAVELWKKLEPGEK